jgi:Family of unknown function (DUF6599)
MKPSGYESSQTEKWMGVLILLCLAVIAGGVVLKQSSFNPAVLVVRNLAPPGAIPETATNPADWLPPELAVFGAPESFTPDNLYDKIDGKAELYLAAGFVRLNCQRFALKAAPDQWVEWFAYDMGTGPQAFSVFTAQRRAEGQPLDLAEYAYRTRNSLHFICGSNYIEAVASTASEPLMNAVTALARRFAAAHASSGARMTQLDLLPPENLVSGSQALQVTDAFGFDQFKNVYTAQYKLNGVELAAFVSSCTDATAAVALRDAYRSFLIANGGKELETQPSGEWGRAIGIMGGIEIVFSRGHFVAGIHAAPDLASGETVASRLYQRLAQQSQ